MSWRTITFAAVYMMCLSSFAQETPVHRCISTEKSDWCVVLDPEAESFTQFGRSDENYFFEARNFDAFARIHNFLLKPRYDEPTDHKTALATSSGFLTLAIVPKKCKFGPCKIELRNPRVETDPATQKKELIIQYFRTDPIAKEMRAQATPPKLVVPKQLFIVALLPVNRLPQNMVEPLQNLSRWSEVPCVKFEVIGEGSESFESDCAFGESQYPVH